MRLDQVVATFEDRDTGRWFEAHRDDRRLVVHAGTIRGGRVDQRRIRRVQTTEWELTMVNDLLTTSRAEPARRSAIARLGGAVEELSHLSSIAGGDPAVVLADLDTEVADLTGRPTAGSLLATMTAATFPLLRPAMTSGATPPSVVPTAIVPYLRAPTAREAAKRAFGRRATRPVVRALAESLRGEDRDPVLEPLNAAILGTTVLPPERLADVLTVRPSVSGRVTYGAREVAAGQQLLGQLHPAVAFRLLVEAVESPEGAVALAEVLSQWVQRGEPDPPPRPRTLSALYDAIMQSPRPEVPVRERPVVAAPPRNRPIPNEPFDMVVPEATPRPARPPTPAPTTQAPTAPGPVDPYPPELRALDGLVVGTMTIVVPAHVDELLAWGRQLGNCLATYREAVTDGISHVIGVRRGTALRYVLELTPSRWVRQFEGRENAPPRPTDREAVMAFLHEQGVLDGRSLQRLPGRNLPAPA